MSTMVFMNRLFLFLALTASAFAVTGNDKTVVLPGGTSAVAQTAITLSTIGTDLGWGGALTAAPATTGAMTVPLGGVSIVTITPTGACTFNASGGVAGQIVTFSITTAGASSFTLTWGTNFRKTGTLATGVTTARFFSVTFRCLDGTIWQEIARTAAQT